MDNSIIDRFWKNVKKTDYCWEWIGEKQNGPQSYGRITIEKNGVRSRFYAHRISYEIANGGFDNSAYVCHHCDNPVCVNPSHLFIGTHTDNMRDMFEKGRRSLYSTERPFCFISPKGEIFTGRNLSKFIQEHALHRRSMQLVLDGRRESYRGWKLHVDTNS